MTTAADTSLDTAPRLVRYAWMFMWPPELTLLVASPIAGLPFAGDRRGFWAPYTLIAAPFYLGLIAAPRYVAATVFGPRGAPSVRGAPPMDPRQSRAWPLLRITRDVGGDAHGPVPRPRRRRGRLLRSALVALRTSGNSIARALTMGWVTEERAGCR
jgi:hypothetical protein